MLVNRDGKKNRLRLGKGMYHYFGRGAVTRQPHIIDQSICATDNDPNSINFVCNVDLSDSNAFVFIIF